MKLRIFGALVAAACLAVAAAALAAGQDRNPQWLRKPSAEDLYAVVPAAAVQQRINGKATILCEVALDGFLRACTIVSEEPRGMGFGAAALALAPQFTMRPAMHNGQLVSTQVQIPISFNVGGGEGPSRQIDAPQMPIGASGPRTLTRLPWDRAPTRADVAAAFPGGTTSGYAIMDCFLRNDGSLSRCSVQRDEPRGKGFGRAALALADRFHTSLAQASGQPLEGAHVMVTVRFDAPGSPDPGISRQLEWVEAPGAADLVFPPAARAADVHAGKGVIDCVIEPSGLLGDCKLAADEPANFGFGPAALALATKFRVNPWVDGRSMDGRRIKLPVGFVDSQPPPTD